MASWSAIARRDPGPAGVCFCHTLFLAGQAHGEIHPDRRRSGDSGTSDSGTGLRPVAEERTARHCEAPMPTRAIRSISVR